MSHASQKNAIIVFAKTPEVGKVKTRLAYDTSDQFSVEFYEVCLRYLFSVLHRNDSDILLYLTPESDKEYFLPYGPHQIFYQINNNNLGSRMVAAFKEQLQHYQNVLLIGSDIPDLNNDILIAAIDSLVDHHAVIGPAKDGGYYLIGFRQGDFMNCFDDMEWSTETVLAETLKKLDGTPLYILPICSDVDTLQDLQRLNKEKLLPSMVQGFLANYPQWF